MALAAIAAGGCQTGSSTPGADAPKASARPGIFTDVARAAGLDFTHFIGAMGSFYFVNVTGPSGSGDTGYGMGAATGDYDTDGYLDLFSVPRGHRTPADERSARVMVGSTR